MEQIKDLTAAQRHDDRQMRDALNANNEPWHLPRFAPHAAHAASEIGADNEDARPDYSGERLGLLIMLVSGIVIVAAMLHLAGRLGWLS